MSTQKQKANKKYTKQTEGGTKQSVVDSSVSNTLLSMDGWTWRELLTPEWAGLLVIGLGLIIVPYFRGLFFDTDMMAVEQILCLLLLAIGIWKWIEHSRKTRVHEIGKFSSVHSKVLFNSRHLFIFALLIPYVIGLWTAVSPYGNWLQLFRYTAYAIVFFMVAEAVSRKPGAGAFLQLAIQISIGWTALFAVAAALGQVTFRDAVTGGRLSSVFQYPNTFAIILAVGIVGGLLLTLRRQWWYQALGGLFLIPMGYVFLLTLSRGAWLFFPIVYLLGMLILPVRAQWAYLIHSVPLAAGVGLLLLGIGTQLEGASAFVVWAWMIAVLTIGAVGYPKLVRVLTGRLLLQGQAVPVDEAGQGDQKVRARTGLAGFMFQLVLPVVIAVLSVGGLWAILTSPAIQKMLPDTIQSRVAEINFETHSVIERGYFNRDALEIFRDYPVFGAGGGGWRALFQQYQDYPYWSTLSHNFFSQLIVETGTVGLVLFAAILLYFIWRGFRCYIASESMEQHLARGFYFVILVGLLGHSVIDFNMSYGYVNFLLFSSLAAWQAGRVVKSNTRHIFSANVLKKVLQSFATQVRLIYTTTYLLLLIIAGTMIFPIHNFSKAEALFVYAGKMLEAGNVSEGLNKLEHIIRISPYKADYHLTYGSVLLAVAEQQGEQIKLQEGIEHIKRVAELAPTQPQILAKAADYLVQSGKSEEAYELMKQALQYGPWDIDLYTLFMKITYRVGEDRLANGDKNAAKEAWENGIRLFGQIGPMHESLGNLPDALNKGRDFFETEEQQLLAGKLHYRLGQFPMAFEKLEPLMDSEDENIKRQAILWGLAAQLQDGIPVEQTVGYKIFVEHSEWADQLRPILTLEIVDGT